MGAVVVAVVVGAAALVVYVTVHEATAATRAGLFDRAFQLGAAALLAVLVGVAALAGYSRWRTVTERPRRPRRPHVASKVEVALAGLLVAGLAVASWPLLMHTYRSAVAGFTALHLAAAVGYTVGGVALLWLVAWSIARYARWQRRWLRQRQQRDKTITKR